MPFGCTSPQERACPYDGGSSDGHSKIGPHVQDAPFGGGINRTHSLCILDESSQCRRMALRLIGRIVLMAPMICLMLLAEPSHDA